MITLAQLTELLGWASIINITYLFFATIIVTFMRGSLSSIHKKMVDIDEKELSIKYFDFISTYKVLTLVLIVAPYLALKLMGN